MAAQIKVLETPRKQGNKADADTLREYADMIESGDLESFVLLGVETGTEDIIAFSRFDDRLKFMGALWYIMGRMGG